MKYCMHCMRSLSEHDETCPFCGNELEKEYPLHHLCPGTELKEKYVVGYAIGQGGFGITYVGWDKTLKIKVAIKEYFPNGYVCRVNSLFSEVCQVISGGNAEFFENGRTRFLEEARVLARFAGEPGIVPVREYFEENNTAYIVMNYLEGEDLKDYLKSAGTISAEETVRLMIPLMETLDKIHKQKVIHRDISPDNIRYTKGKLVLLDFGAARTVTTYSDISLSIMLKPGYAPFEQYSRNKTQGAWTDVYALCATMYKCITGVTPPDVTDRFQVDTIKTPEVLGFQITPEVQAAIMKGLSVLPEDRFQTVEALIHGIQGVTSETKEDRPTMPKPPVLNPPAPGETSGPFGPGNSEPKEPPNPPKPPEPPKPPKRGDEGLWWKIILFVLLGLVLGGFLVALTLGIGKAVSGSSRGEPTGIPTPTVTIGAKEENASLVMSEEWSDFIFTLEGVVYQLPCDYQCFEAAGWSMDASQEETVEGKGAFTVKMYQGEKWVIVTLYNPTEGKKTLENCVVGAIKVQQKDNVIMELPGGITFNSSREDVEKLLSSEWFIGEYSDRYSGDKYTMELVYEDKLKLSEVTVGVSNLELWAEQKTPMPTPTLEPTPSPEPTPTETPVPVAEDEYAVGFALQPYDNGGEEYDYWWGDSELNLNIRNAFDGASTGKVLMTAYIPTGTLQDGIYGIELFAQNNALKESDFMGFGSATEFSVVDGKIIQRDTTQFTKVKTGYVCKLETNYTFEEVPKNCYIVVKLHSSTPGENGQIYFGNFCVQDEQFGSKYLDMESGEYTASLVRLSTGEKLEFQHIPGNYLWIYE